MRHLWRRGCVVSAKRRPRVCVSHVVSLVAFSSLGFCLAEVPSELPSMALE